MDENINQQLATQQPMEQGQTRQDQDQARMQANAVILDSMKRGHHTMMIFVLASITILFGLLIYYLYTINNASSEISPAVQTQPRTNQSPVIKISPSPVVDTEVTDDVGVVDVEMDLLDLNKDLQGL